MSILAVFAWCVWGRARVDSEYSEQQQQQRRRPSGSSYGGGDGVSRRASHTAKAWGPLTVVVVAMNVEWEARGLGGVEDDAGGGGSGGPHGVLVTYGGRRRRHAWRWAAAAQRARETAAEEWHSSAIIATQRTRSSCSGPDAALYHAARCCAARAVAIGVRPMRLEPDTFPPAVVQSEPRPAARLHGNLTAPHGLPGRETFGRFARQDTAMGDPGSTAGW
ncbi:unnamed protein product [Lampetra planeri]